LLSAQKLAINLRRRNDNTIEAVITRDVICTAVEYVRKRGGDTSSGLKLLRVAVQYSTLSRVRFLLILSHVECTLHYYDSEVALIFNARRHVFKATFDGEIGTRIGPTLEFYSILAEELQRDDLNLWRSTKRIRGTGLYPCSRSPE
jgi:hypothetical protein